MIPAGNWVGRVCLPLKLSVYAVGSGEPLGGVNVLVAKLDVINGLRVGKEEDVRAWKMNLSRDKFSGETDTKGMVSLSAFCPAGSGSMFQSGHFGVPQIVEINHPGFRPLLIPLASLLGEQSFPLSKKVLEAKVWLIPVPPDTVSKPIK